MAKCKRCGCEGLVWKQSKKQKWYLAVEKIWQGDMGNWALSFVSSIRLGRSQMATSTALDGGSVWWRQSTGEIADVGS